MGDKVGEKQARFRGMVQPVVGDGCSRRHIGRSAGGAGVMRSVAFLVLASIAASCQGAAEPAPAAEPIRGQAPASQPARAPAPAPAAEAMSAERSIRTLEKLVAIDRKTLEMGESRLERIRDLHSAGRLSQAELNAAELEVLRLRRALLLRERELAEANIEAGGDGRLPER